MTLPNVDARTDPIPFFSEGLSPVQTSTMNAQPPAGEDGKNRMCLERARGPIQVTDLPYNSRSIVISRSRYEPAPFTLDKSRDIGSEAFDEPFARKSRGSPSSGHLIGRPSHEPLPALRLPPSARISGVYARRCL
jgi:hypothetical protein